MKNLYTFLILPFIVLFMTTFNNDSYAATLCNDTISSPKIVLDSLTPQNTRIVEVIPDKAVCSKLIHIEVSNDGIIQNVTYNGGCNGNTQGISALIKGMKVSEAIERLKGIKCRGKGTSCPDQLAQALMSLGKKN